MIFSEAGTQKKQKLICIWDIDYEYNTCQKTFSKAVTLTPV